MSVVTLSRKHIVSSCHGPVVQETSPIEMDYDNNINAFDNVPIAECLAETGKAALKARWIHKDEGTRYWCRRERRSPIIQTQKIGSRRRHQEAMIMLDSSHRHRLKNGRRTYKRSRADMVSDSVRRHQWCATVVREG